MVKNQIGIFPSSTRNSRQIRYSKLYFKVPADQRKANPDAFEPYLFSFGLYHAVIPPADANAVTDSPPAAASYEDRSATVSENEDRSAAISENSNEESGIHAVNHSTAAVLKEYRDACNQLDCNSDDGDHFKYLTAKALLNNDALRDLVGLIREKDSEFRKLYIQMPPVKLNAISASSLALRLALDSITIVAAALNPIEQTTSPMIYPIARLSLSDGILLENQVPILLHWFVIQALKMQSAMPSNIDNSDCHLQMLHQALEWYRERASPFPNFIRENPPDVDPTSKKHLLHYIYNYLTEADSFIDAPQQQVSTPPGDQGKINSQKPSPPHTELPIQEDGCSLTRKSSCIHELQDPSLPTASRLARCGVEFEFCDASFQGIGFSKSCMTAKLSIPRIAVSDTTVRSLHNLLAYEATARYPAESFVISYVHFMDRLIDTEEDVRVLVDAGVIGNVLGSHEELATMWNKLCISVSCRMTKKDSNIMAQLEALAKKRLRRWWASFKEKYWEKQPWLITSIVVAVILLVLTFLQTLYTMKDSGNIRRST